LIGRALSRRLISRLADKGDPPLTLGKDGGNPHLGSTSFLAMYFEINRWTVILGFVRIREGAEPSPFVLMLII
jgi:hypothetical protein